MTATIAAATGMPEAAVGVVVRFLREDGLLTTGARGVNAPNMTPLDAARVLIALIASSRQVDAPKSVRDFGSLRHLASQIPTPPLEVHGRSFADFKIDLPKYHLFEDGLAWLIQSLANNEDLPLWLPPYGPKSYLAPSFEVSANINLVMCWIKLPFVTYQYAHVPFDPSSGESFTSLSYSEIRGSYNNSKIHKQHYFTSDVLIPICADFREV